MSTLSGNITLDGLPPHRFVGVSLSLFNVPSLSSAPPYGGEPPADAYSDENKLTELSAPYSGPISFQIQRSAGYYYLDVGVIAV